MIETAAVVDEKGRLTLLLDRRLAIAWLGLGVTALALAGVFAILLVLARSPGTSTLFPTQDFFRVALIVHVDQSVLIWFLAFAGLLWTLGAKRSRRRLSALSNGAFLLAAAGCLVVAAAPFLGARDPVLNNYVPVLDHPLFLTGLALFGTGVLLQVAGFLMRGGAAVAWSDPIGVGIATAAFAALMAALSLLWTWKGLPTDWESKGYYEYLFWPAGHVLQFAYTQLMLVAWLWLLRASGRPIGVAPGWLSGILVLGVLPLLLVPLIHAVYAPQAAQTRLAFIDLMRWGNGLAAVPIGFLVGASLLRHRQSGSDAGATAATALVWSLILFVAGGILGVLIVGVNTVIPAHYHGSIVGVTLALMGLTYHLLPELGLRAATGTTARIQPVLYATGQLLHIGGLAASGALGIERKTAGAAQVLPSVWAKTFMGIMGAGGLLAVIGGILFVVVVLRALRKDRG